MSANIALRLLPVIGPSDSVLRSQQIKAARSLAVVMTQSGMAPSPELLASASGKPYESQLERRLIEMAARMRKEAEMEASE